MFGFKLRSPLMKFLSGSLLLCCLSWGLMSCSDRLEAANPMIETAPTPVKAGQLSEVAPPAVIQELRQVLAQYHPQVSIISPKSNQMFSETTVSVQLQVKDYPLFKNAELGMGPHLHLFVDNEPYQAIYNVDEPIVLKELTPGTHTIRVFASRPWHESFKNEGAYAETTFNIFTETENNAPKPDFPLLTYSRPQGNYGAEPIMLDFYLTNAPLHFVAQNNPDDDIVDWRIKATVNGESFLVDTWQPIYLKGFKTGKNWIQLEFLDEQGQEINNTFNNTVRLITYEPNGQDTLSKMVRGELPVEVARALVDPNYRNALIPEPTTQETLIEDSSTLEKPQEDVISPVEETTLEATEPSLTSEEEPTPLSVTQEILEETPSPVTEDTISEAVETVENEASETVSPSEPKTEITSESTPDAVSDAISSESSVITTEETSTPVSESVEPQTSPLSKRPQWLQNLTQFVKQINLNSLTEKG
ncbi:hypothetical protein [Crocosphaera sp. XPORK-15E]|uniref:hypothetical protein n=1 Tax=Crocosphaera sp. XPORK-15E TaxID=3110247 RepID=UPI002B20A7C7|nr:hypothetical protein [Crocosphaera sp. XPORK-15E]MEA5534925.1 hypothetical protein [Crocosphaera sp. XPORK-15E]